MSAPIVTEEQVKFVIDTLVDAHEKFGSHPDWREYYCENFVATGLVHIQTHLLTTLDADRIVNLVKDFAEKAEQVEI